MKRVLSLAIVLMLAFSCVFTAFAQTDDTASPDDCCFGCTCNARCKRCNVRLLQKKD